MYFINMKLLMKTFTNDVITSFYFSIQYGESGPDCNLIATRIEVKTYKPGSSFTNCLELNYKRYFINSIWIFFTLFHQT